MLHLDRDYLRDPVFEADSQYFLAAGRKKRPGAFVERPLPLLAADSLACQKAGQRAPVEPEQPLLGRNPCGWLIFLHSDFSAILAPRP